MSIPIDDPIEDERLAIIEDLINREFADEVDPRQLTDYVFLLRLCASWPTTFSGARLLELTYDRLYMFKHRAWPESTLCESLALVLYETIEGDNRRMTPMVDRQWFPPRSSARQGIWRMLQTSESPEKSTAGLIASQHTTQQRHTN